MNLYIELLSNLNIEFYQLVCTGTIRYNAWTTLYIDGFSKHIWRTGRTEVRNGDFTKPRVCSSSYRILS